jgi:O-methyltransferase involved in polyketide biosynthesis
MAEIQNVAGTAFIVAEMRASENAEVHPLYRDPIVPLFLSNETRTAAERFSAVFPPIKRSSSSERAISMTDSTGNFIMAASRWLYLAPGSTRDP